MDSSVLRIGPDLERETQLDMDPPLDMPEVLTYAPEKNFRKKSE